jgi:N,N'-diacetyllegionaminate synthase
VTQGLIRLPWLSSRNRDRCFIIAEAGINHNGDLELAKRLVDVAVEAKADAVKFQTFKAERLVTQTAPKAAYQQRSTGPLESQFQMLKRLELSEQAHRDLFQYCLSRKISFLSTPFDEDSADFLNELGVTAFKISSGDITNLLLLEHVARKQKPMIVSTGMSTLEEVRTAVNVMTGTGNRNITLLHCVSQYPATPADANLKAMQTMAGRLGFPVGYSDHTLGIEIALAAVTLGAVVIEKHFTLDRTLPGPDHSASLEPQELTALVKGIRNVEVALGHGRKEPSPTEASTAAAARRSLVAARTIPAGSVVTSDMVVSRRPGTGLSPSMLPSVVGRSVLQEIPAGTLLTLDMLS